MGDSKECRSFVYLHKDIVEFHFPEKCLFLGDDSEEQHILVKLVAILSALRLNLSIMWKEYEASGFIKTIQGDERDFIRHFDLYKNDVMDRVSASAEFE